jgi:hypothetical protein
MTQCSQSEFEFKGHFSRRVGAAFDGGTMTSDGGALLLRETDRRLNLLPRLAECFLDRRNPVLVTHPVAEMLAQRVYALALGYEDLNDHEQLRQDPLLTASRNSFTCLPAAPARRRCAPTNSGCTSRGWRTCWSAAFGG